MIVISTRLEPFSSRLKRRNVDRIQHSIASPVELDVFAGEICHRAAPLDAVDVDDLGHDLAACNGFGEEEAGKAYCRRSAALSEFVEPLGKRILIRKDESRQKTRGGIVLPDAAQEKPQRGKVVATGPGKLLDSGNRGELSVKVGDEVIFGKYGGNLGTTGCVGFQFDTRGTITVPAGQSPRIGVEGNEGYRLWIDDSLVVNVWQKRSYATTFAARALTPATSAPHGLVPEPSNVTASSTGLVTSRMVRSPVTTVLVRLMRMPWFTGSAWLM